MSLSLYSVVWVRKDPVCSWYAPGTTMYNTTRILNTTLHATELKKLQFCQIHRLPVLLTSDTGLQITEYCSTVVLLLSRERDSSGGCSWRDNYNFWTGMFSNVMFERFPFDLSIYMKNYCRTKYQKNVHFSFVGGHPFYPAPIQRNWIAYVA
jgi:hypothetical protein